MKLTNKEANLTTFGDRVAQMAGMNKGLSNNKSRNTSLLMS